MATIKGYDGRFGLRCWRDTRRTDFSHEVASHDDEALRTMAATLVRTGACRHVEFLAWSFELNDWVRLESFAAE